MTNDETKSAGAGDLNGAQSDRTLGHDLPCPRCGYNLRGLPYDRACPECGLMATRTPPPPLPSVPNVVEEFDRQRDELTLAAERLLRADQALRRHETLLERWEHLITRIERVLDRIEQKPPT